MNHPLVLRIKQLDAAAIVPCYKTAGAACFDLHSTEAGIVMNGGATVFNTGLAFEIPPGWVMLVYSRSGHGFNHAVRLSNCVGVIDSDYRGEVQVSLRRDQFDTPFAVAIGDRIAQAMLVPAQRVHMMLVSELSDTERGAGGFGSTGK